MRSLPLLLIAFLCSGCATTGSSDIPEVNDPFERANRAVFSFNRTADRYVLRPVATGYH
ncbi:MAG: MlaA family lipoprotein, partial [Gammaproteobacteria bacterium]